MKDVDDRPEVVMHCLHVVCVLLPCAIIWGKKTAADYIASGKASLFYSTKTEGIHASFDFWHGNAGGEI